MTVLILFNLCASYSLIEHVILDKNINKSTFSNTYCVTFFCTQLSITFFAPILNLSRAEPLPLLANVPLPALLSLARLSILPLESKRRSNLVCSSICEKNIFTLNSLHHIPGNIILNYFKSC